MPRPLAPLLAAVVAARLAYLVTGGTGSGKTTLLNTLLGLVPADRADRAGRGRRRAASGASARGGAPGAYRQRGGRGRGQAARPGPAGAADAPGPAGGRRVPGRRGGRPAGRAEHRPRRRRRHAARQHPGRRAGPVGGARACSVGCPAPRCTPRWPPRCRCCSRCDGATEGRVLESVCLLLPEGPERLVTVVPAWVRGRGLGLAARALGRAAAGAGRGGAADPQRAVARIGGSGMTAETLLVAALLLVAAALVAWPVRSIRARRRRVLAPGRRAGGLDPDDALVQWIRELGRTADGLVDGTGAAPTSGHLVGIAASRVPLPGSTEGGRHWAGPAGTSPAARGGRQRQAGSPVRRARRVRRPVEIPDARPAPPGRRRPSPCPTPAQRPGRVGGHDRARCLPIGRGRSTRRSGPATADGHGDLDAGTSERRVRCGGGRRVRDRRLPRPAGRRPDRQNIGYGAVGAHPAIDGPRAASDRSARRRCGCRGRRSGGGGRDGRLRHAGRARRAALARNRSAERTRRRGLDQLCGLAADLRAGLPVPQALEVAAVGTGRGGPASVS